VQVFLFKFLNDFFVTFCKLALGGADFFALVTRLCKVDRLQSKRFLWSFFEFYDLIGRLCEMGGGLIWIQVCDFEI
jgi:hypothetical protein